MAYISYVRLGNPKDIELEPTPGNTYWVVLRTQNAEVAFQALLTTSVKRDHNPPEQDRTPSFQFDNGVVLHGEGIKFFRKMPEKPLKNLRFCDIYRHAENGSYELLSNLSGEEHEKQFANLQELQAFLRTLDIDEVCIPQEDFDGSKEFEIML